MSQRKLRRDSAARAVVGSAAAAVKAVQAAFVILPELPEEPALIQKRIG